MRATGRASWLSDPMGMVKRSSPNGCLDIAIGHVFSAGGGTPRIPPQS